MRTLKEIEQEVEREYAFDRYKAVCETIKGYELQIEYLNTKEGREANNPIAGSAKVDNLLLQMGIVLKERIAEKEFLEKKLR